MVKVPSRFPLTIPWMGMTGRKAKAAILHDELKHFSPSEDHTGIGLSENI